MPDLSTLQFHEVDLGRWSDFERLFEAPGGPHNCWCMVWRASAEERRQRSKATRKAALKGRVHSGVRVGILAYLDDEPVGWCSIAPRETYQRLGWAQVTGDERVWSLACFFGELSP